MLFTVFTPTHNRRHTLGRVFDSLRRQSCRDFEWLIVDDGSTDDTETLVRGFQADADFPIRYVAQPNRGKHVAFNTATRDAAGELIVPLDSDDACVPEALERLRHHWIAIPAEARTQFLGVTCTCQDEDGRRLGPPLPQPLFDSDARTAYFRLGIAQELWGAARVDILRQHPFPVNVRGYVPESVLWFQLARTYRIRYVDEPLRIYYQDNASIMRTPDPARNSAGALIGATAVLRDAPVFFFDAPLVFLREAAQYVRYANHVQEWPDTAAVALPWFARLLIVAAAPVGFLAWIRDRYRARGSGVA